MALFSTEVEHSAWKVLNRGLAEGNPAKRVQALTALASIGPATPHVLDLLEVGLVDKDPTVRQAAAAVIGEVQAKPAIPMLKKALDDDSDEVSFTAAQSLWKMGDQSGREILWAVMAGERKTGPGMIQGGIRDAKSKLRSPAALAKIGVDQASGFLGPFSMGVWFAEDFLKDKGAPARSIAAKLLASDPDSRTTIELEEALEDKNSAVRAMAARALGQRCSMEQRCGPEETAKLQVLLSDGNEGVRDMAAAAIIRLNQPRALPSRQPKGRPSGPSVKSLTSKPAL